MKELSSTDPHITRRKKKTRGAATLLLLYFIYQLCYDYPTLTRYSESDNAHPTLTRYRVYV